MSLPDVHGLLNELWTGGEDDQDEFLRCQNLLLNDRRAVIREAKEVIRGLEEPRQEGDGPGICASCASVVLAALDVILETKP